jgi:hypothetical protein
LSKKEQTEFLQLLEMQYHAMLMYTSCGWFFDEVTGIETMQDIMYAARAIQLAGEVGNRSFELNFLKILADAKSNIPEIKNAAHAYDKFVKPAIVDLHRVGAHYAISSIFSEYPEKVQIYSYTAEAQSYELQEAGKYKLAIGKALLRSNITGMNIWLLFQSFTWATTTSLAVSGNLKMKPLFRKRKETSRVLSTKAMFMKSSC